MLLDIVVFTFGGFNVEFHVPASTGVDKLDSSSKSTFGSLLVSRTLIVYEWADFFFQLFF